jgi:hypothetical protein
MDDILSHPTPYRAPELQKQFRDQYPE